MRKADVSKERNRVSVVQMTGLYQDSHCVGHEDQGIVVRELRSFQVLLSSNASRGH